MIITTAVAAKLAPTKNERASAILIKSDTRCWRMPSNGSGAVNGIGVLSFSNDQRALPACRPRSRLEPWRSSFGDCARGWLLRRAAIVLAARRVDAQALGFSHARLAIGGAGHRGDVRYRARNRQRVCP